MVFGFSKLAPQSFYSSTVSALLFSWEINYKISTIRNALVLGPHQSTPFFSPAISLGRVVALPDVTASGLSEGRTWLDSLRPQFFANSLHLHLQILSVSE